MTIDRLLAASLLCAGLAIAAPAQTGSTAQGDGTTAQDPPVPTLEDLQRQIDELREAQEEMPVTGGTDPTMRIFGRIHLDYWGFFDTDPAINVFENGNPLDDPNNNLEFRRARLGVDGDVGENMRYKIELDFGDPSDMVFKDLFFGWDDLPVLETLLIGNQKRPYGLDHLNSSRYNVFAERPFFVEANNQDARRFGVASYGVSEQQMWNWRYGIYDMTDWSAGGEIVADRVQPELTGRLASTAWYDEESDGRNYGHFAVSGSVGFPDGDGSATNLGRYRTRPEARSQSRWIDTGAIAGAETSYLAGFETALNFDALQIVGEYQGVWVDRSMASTAFFQGAYVYIAYFLNGYMPWSRSSGTLARPKIDEGSGLGAWQVALRYSYSDYTDEGIFGGMGEALTVGLNWYFHSHASVQFNWISGEISDRMVDPPPPGGPIFSSGDYNIFGVRFRVDF